MLTIGEVARQSGVSKDALRFYERIGLLRPEARSEAGYRLYDESAVERVRFIKLAQGLGFQLEEIASMLEVMAEGKPPCAHVRAMLEEKVAEIEAKIAALTELRNELKTRLEWARQHPDPACDGKNTCVYLEPPAPLT